MMFSAGLLSTSRDIGPTIMEPEVEPAGRDDRPSKARAGRRRFAIASALIVGSLLLHACAFILLLKAPDRTAVLVPEIIPVDVVIEPPKPPAPKAAENAAPTSTQAPAAEAPPQKETAKAEPPPTAEQDARPSQTPPLPPTPNPTATGRFDGMPASFRAITLPPTSIGGAEAANYKAIVFGLLAAAKQYPERARTRGVSGAAVVAFSVDTSGHVQYAAIARSSGDADLDAETLATVHHCDPFPPPPQGAQTSFAAAIEFESEP
jgi:protein TonB